MIESVLKDNNINIFGENSLYEYSIKNKLKLVKEFLLQKIRTENIKLCDHEDLFKACQDGTLTEVSYLVEIKHKEVN